MKIVQPTQGINLSLQPTLASYAGPSAELQRLASYS